MLEVNILKKFELEPSFDIIEFCKSSRIQISLIDYLKSSPSELDKLIKFIRGSTSLNKAQYVNVVSFTIH